MENVSRSVACQLERGIAPNGCPQLPNLLRFKVIFRTFSFPPSLPLSPFAFHLASPILQGVNKKLSYRGQDAYAFSVIKHTNTIMTPNMYLSVHQSRIPGVYLTVILSSVYQNATRVPNVTTVPIVPKTTKNDSLPKSCLLYQQNDYQHT